VRWTLKEYPKLLRPQHKNPSFKINPTLILTLIIGAALLNSLGLISNKKIIKPVYRFYSDPNIYIEVK
jgi:hypothetical protein